MQLEHLPDCVDVRGLHDGAVARAGDRDQDALGLEGPDRLTDRAAPDVEPCGELAFRGESAASGEGAVQDPGPMCSRTTSKPLRPSVIDATPSWIWCGAELLHEEVNSRTQQSASP